VCFPWLQAPQQRTGRKSYSLRASSKALVQHYFFMSQLAPIPD
jgi:hypothetical protein